MADVTQEDSVKSTNSKESSDCLESENLQDATKSKSAGADSEYESAEEDERDSEDLNESTQVLSKASDVEVQPDTSSLVEAANEAATESSSNVSPSLESELANAICNQPSNNDVSSSEMVSEASKDVVDPSPLDTEAPVTDLPKEEESLAQTEVLDQPQVADTEVEILNPETVLNEKSQTLEDNSRNEENSLTNEEKSLPEEDASTEADLSRPDQSSSPDVQLENESTELTETLLLETLETYPLDEELKKISCDQVFATTHDSSEGIEKEEDLGKDVSNPEADGTEESESLDAFCGGSTSGDFLDEEGGMEGVAEVEDDDCQFLEEEEEELEDGEIEEQEETDDAQEYAEGERQQGDGEESVSPCPSKEKVLDDDEDRRNPQYIPKKGSFYEHDDRAGSEAEEDKEQKEKDKKKTKKLWSDDGRWGHDMFREEEQAPKTREELIACYGYDIRSEDGPPRARRRRRYGRGPNKYTRNWQDEDAYVRGGHEGERADSRAEISSRGGRGQSRGSRIFRGNRGRRGRGGIGDSDRQMSNSNINNNNNINVDMPRRNETDKEPSSTETMSYSTAINNNKNLEPCLTAEEFPALPSKDEPVESSATDTTNVNNNNNSSMQAAVSDTPSETQVFRTLTFENSRLSGRSDNREPPRGRGRGTPSSAPNQERRGSYARGRRGGNRGGPPKGMGSTQLVESEDLYNLQAEMEKMKIQDASLVGQPTHRKEANKERINTAAQESNSNQKINEGRPKRYSSLRQRGIQETSNYQPPQTQSQYYEPGYPGSMYGDHLPPSTQHQPAAPSPVNPLMTNTYPGNYNPSPYQDTFSAALRAPMPSPPRLYHPPGPAQPVVASPYLPPNMGPNGALMNYGGPPPPPPAGAYPPQFQLLQPYGSPQPGPPAPSVVSQTHELYTGGITYYSPHGQQFVSSGRAMPQKRPKAAIPIVPPPESQVSGGYENFMDSRSHSEVIDPSTGVLEVES